MRRLKLLKHHWTFCFILTFFALQWYDQQTLWLFIVLLISLIRICFLGIRRASLFILITVIICIKMHSDIQYNQKLTELPLENQTTEVIVEVNPLDIQSSNQSARFSGKIISLNKETTLKQPISTIGYLPVDEMEWEKEESNQLIYIKGEAEFNRPHQARNFHTFDYRKYLETQGIVWQLTLKKAQLVSYPQKNKLFNKLQNLRIKYLTHFKQFEDTSWGALHNKLLWNMDSRGYREFREGLSLLGIVHFFAISGFHIYFIRRILYYIMIRCGITIETSQKCLDILLFIYACLIAWPVGVLRSLGVGYLTRLGKKASASLSQLDYLAIFGLMMLLYHPLWSKSLSFILSFLMTYLIKFYIPISRKLKRNERQEQVELTLLCLLFSWPILIQLNYQINLFQFIFLLVVACVFERVIMPLMMFSTLISFTSYGRIVFTLLSQLFDFIWERLLHPLASWNGAITTGYLPLLSWLLLLFAGILWLYLLDTKPKVAYLSVVIIYTMVLGIMPYLSLTHKVTIIDVGQGDALVYQPALSKQAWVIDTGGRVNWNRGDDTYVNDEDYAYQTIIPALKALGIGKITGLIITHPDTDHLGNMKSLIKAIPVQQIYVTPYTLNSQLWKSFNFSTSTNKKIKEVPFGHSLNLSGTQMRLYTLDEETLRHSQDQSNDSSIITTIRLGAYQFINLGDLSAEGEKKIVKSYPNLRADFVKIGHHGSQTSTSKELLETLHSSLALISSGVNNRYGHPHKVVLDRLESYQIDHLCTKQVGAISIQIHPFWGLKIKTAINE